MNLCSRSNWILTCSNDVQLLALLKKEAAALQSTLPPQVAAGCSECGGTTIVDNACVTCHTTVTPVVCGTALNIQFLTIQVEAMHQLLCSKRPRLIEAPGLVTHMFLASDHECLHLLAHNLRDLQVWNFQLQRQFRRVVLQPLRINLPLQVPITFG